MGLGCETEANATVYWGMIVYVFMVEETSLSLVGLLLADLAARTRAKRWARLKQLEECWSWYEGR